MRRKMEIEYLFEAVEKESKMSGRHYDIFDIRML